jgi:endo-1,4-beta-D-glucanase Y
MNISNLVPVEGNKEVGYANQEETPMGQESGRRMCVWQSQSGSCEAGVCVCVPSWHMPNFVRFVRLFLSHVDWIRLKKIMKDFNLFRIKNSSNPIKFTWIENKRNMRL